MEFGLFFEKKNEKKKLKKPNLLIFFFRDSFGDSSRNNSNKDKLDRLGNNKRFLSLSFLLHTICIFFSFSFPHFFLIQFV